MRIKDYTDTIRHLTDSFNIPEARRMIQENPALTQEQFKAGGIVEPGVTHYGSPSPGSGPRVQTDAEAAKKYGDLLQGKKWSQLTKQRKRNISGLHTYYKNNPERLGTGQVQPREVFIPKEELKKLRENLTAEQIAKKKNISPITVNRLLKKHDLIDPDYNLPLEKQYKINELNKATEHFTKGKLKKFNDLDKLDKNEKRVIKTQISNTLTRKKGKFDLDPKAGKFKKIYFKNYSNKDFIKDLKNKRSPYEIAENYYAKNKKFVNKQMLGTKEYTKPIGYLSKVLGLRVRADPEVARELKKYREWSAMQKGPNTFEAYTKRIEKLIPLAIEQGIIPKNIKTSGDYYNYVKKTRINPLMGLFNYLEKIGVEHIGGISRALELSDAKTLQEIVPLLGGHEVNVAKGWKYDRPMTGLVKNILKSEFPSQKVKNLEALNKKALAASKAYHVPVSEYKLGKKGLERITSGKTLTDDVLTDADLLMKQYAATGGEKRASFKHLDPDVQKTIRMYEAGDVKAGKKQLKISLDNIGKDIRKWDTPTLVLYGKKMGCIKRAEGTDIASCLQKKLAKNPEQFAEFSSSLAKSKNAKTAKNSFNLARKLMTVSKFTGWGLVGEAVFAPLIALPMWAKGTPKDEIVDMLTYGAFGQGREEKIQEKLSPLGKAYAKTQELNERGQALSNQLTTASEQGYERSRIEHDLRELEKEYEQAASIFTPDPITGDYNQELINKGAQEVDDVTKYFEDITSEGQKERAAWLAPKTSKVMETIIDKPGKAFIDFTLGPNWKENLPEQQNQFYKKKYPRNPRELGQHLSYDPDIPMFAEGGIAGLLKK